MFIYPTLFQKLRGGAGPKRYGMDFFVHVNEKKKIRETITVYAPVNGKICTFYITLNQRQYLTFGTVYVISLVAARSLLKM